MRIEQPVFLIGFMGAGKSTIGRILSARLGCDFVDLDTLIEEKTGKSINAIFAEDGEDCFRKQETTALVSLTTSSVGVYATGGGIVVAEKNRELMRSAGYVIYLRATWATLLERLTGSTQRPLLNTENGLLKAQVLLSSRSPYYEEAELIVDTDHKSADVVVDEILGLLGVKQ